MLCGGWRLSPCRLTGTGAVESRFCCCWLVASRHRNSSLLLIAAARCCCWLAAQAHLTSAGARMEAIGMVGGLCAAQWRCKGLVAAREAAKLGTRLCGPDSRGIRRSQSPPVCGPREQVGEGRGSRARVCCTMREAARNADAHEPLTGAGRPRGALVEWGIFSHA